jgi:hypothetical protein
VSAYFEPFTPWKENYMLRNLAWELPSDADRFWNVDIRRWPPGAPGEDIRVINQTRYFFDLQPYSGAPGTVLPLLGEVPTQWIYQGSYLAEIGLIRPPPNTVPPTTTLPTGTRNWYGLPVESVLLYSSTGNGGNQYSAVLTAGNSIMGPGSIFFSNPQQPQLQTESYYFCPITNPEYAGSSTFPQPGHSQFTVTATSPLLCASVGQPSVFAGWAKQSIFNGYPDKFAYLGQYFDKAYTADPLTGQATTTETGILSEYGDFFPTEPGLTILKTKYDPDQVGSPGGAQGEARSRYRRMRRISR